MTELPQKEYELIKDCIQNSVNIGHFKFWCDYKLHASVKNKLRSEGFKVSDNVLLDSGGTTISWK